MDMGVGMAQAFSWGAAVLFAYVVNKLIVFKNYDLRPSYLMKEAGAFLMTRGISGVAVWLLMVVMVKSGRTENKVSLTFFLYCRNNLI